MRACSTHDRLNFILVGRLTAFIAPVRVLAAICVCCPIALLQEGCVLVTSPRLPTLPTEGLLICVRLRRGSNIKEAVVAHI